MCNVTENSMKLDESVEKCTVRNRVVDPDEGPHGSAFNRVAGFGFNC
jgi:hypothetical protein